MAIQPCVCMDLVHSLLFMPPLIFNRWYRFNILLHIPSMDGWKKGKVMKRSKIRWERDQCLTFPCDHHWYLCNNNYEWMNIFKHTYTHTQCFEWLFIAAFRPLLLLPLSIESSGTSRRDDPLEPPSWHPTRLERERFWGHWERSGTNTHNNWHHKKMDPLSFDY